MLAQLLTGFISNDQAYWNDGIMESGYPENPSQKKENISTPSLNPSRRGREVHRKAGGRAQCSGRTIRLTQAYSHFLPNSLQTR
jgi:hypothetical protein